MQGARRPDLTLLLDRAGRDRRLQRVARARDAGTARDRFERERAEFFERVRAGYLRAPRPSRERIRGDRCGTAPADEVTRADRSPR